MNGVLIAAEFILKYDQMVYKWNATATDYPKHKSICAIFDEIVASRADKVAVICEDEQNTYSELNNRATELAQYLLALGVKEEELVAVSLERSINFIVAILAVLKAGAAYVPVDVGYPTNLVQFIVNDTKSKIIITETSFLQEFSWFKGRIVNIHDYSVPDNKSDCEPNLKSRNLAYVMYTSGSTGSPKGVLVEHKNVVRLVKNTNYIDINAKDKMAQASNISFDASTFEIWGALLNGAKLVIISIDKVLQIDLFLKELKRQRVNILWLTAGLFNEIVNNKPNAFAKLKYLLVGGEVLNPITVLKVQLQEKTAPKYLINCYGPTEGTTFTATYLIPIGFANNQNVSIGQPVANTTVYILDEHLRPADVGEAGELYIGGDGVVRGYLNRNDLTRERFIANPFVKHDRLYRSGDICKWMVDGKIEFIGRKDRQIKLRGYRIEPGEIEAIIKQCNRVIDAIVVMREDQPDQKCLAAYLLIKSNKDKSQNKSIIDDINSMLIDNLPDYMIPVVYVVLDKFPLNINNKVDINSLPIPHRRDYLVKDRYIVPKTELEKDIADIWREVLQVNTIGVDDNFFSLGGHSLAATHIIAKLQQRNTTIITLDKFFSHPTIRQIAKYVKEVKSGKNPPYHKQIHKLKKRDHVPLSFAQQGLWIVDQVVVHKAVYNVPLILHIRGNLNKIALQQSIDDLIARHEILRTTILLYKEYAAQKINDSDGVIIDYLDIQSYSVARKESRLQSIIDREARYEFKLASEMPVRSKLIKHNNDQYVFIINIHHIAFDGWSIKILLRDLFSYYSYHNEGKKVCLPKLPVQYVDYAAWQRELFNLDIFGKQIKYWQKQLQNSPETSTFAVLKNRLAEKYYSGKTYHYLLKTVTVSKLDYVCKKHDVTLFMSLFSCYVTLLYRYSGQDDLVVGVPVSNRHHTQIEDLIGYFVNSLPIRIQGLGKLNFIQLLQVTKKTILDGFANQDIPFELMVEKLNIQRTLGHHPIFQVMFTLQDDFDMPIQIPGLDVECKEADSSFAKFDLTLSIRKVSNGLDMAFEYAVGLFEDQAITCLVQHYINMVTLLIEEPRQSISVFI